jgi:hypothetical protein
MKRHFNIPLAIIVLAGVLSVSAKAQTSGAQRVIANIPFAFSVGKTNLPAGKYTFSVVNPSSDRKILQIRSMDGRVSAMILTTDLVRDASDNAKLVFDRYGNHYYFAKAQMAGDSTTLAAVKAKEWPSKQLASAKKSVIVIVVR